MDDHAKFREELLQELRELREENARLRQGRAEERITAALTPRPWA